MKSKYVLPSLLVAIGLAFAGFLIGKTLVNGKQMDRQVSVKGLAEREVPADLAVWPLQIRYAGNNLASLQQTLTRAQKDLQRFFADQGFSGEEISKGMTNIVDSNADPYRSANQPPVNRYTATADFTLRTSDIKKLEGAVSASPTLIEKGIIVTSKNMWMPIEYLFTGLNAIKPAMVEEANKNARVVAEKFAQDSGSTVGKIKSARQGLFSIGNRDQYTPQIKVVRVVNTVDYYLED